MNSDHLLMASHHPTASERLQANLTTLKVLLGLIPEQIHEQMQSMVAGDLGGLVARVQDIKDVYEEQTQALHTELQLVQAQTQHLADQIREMQTRELPELSANDKRTLIKVLRDIATDMDEMKEDVDTLKEAHAADSPHMRDEPGDEPGDDMERAHAT